MHSDLSSGQWCNEFIVQSYITFRRRNIHLSNCVRIQLFKGALLYFCLYLTSSHMVDACTALLIVAHEQSHIWLVRNLSRFSLILIGVHTKLRKLFNRCQHIFKKPSSSSSVPTANNPLSPTSMPPCTPPERADWSPNMSAIRSVYTPSLCRGPPLVPGLLRRARSALASLASFRHFFFRSSTLRNVVDRALTSAATASHPFFLSLFDNVDLNRPCSSSFLWPYACIKATLSAWVKLSLRFRCCRAASAMVTGCSQNAAIRLSVNRAGSP